MDNSRKFEEKAQWCIDQHRNTNHTYDGEPYEFHLEMVVSAVKEFIEIGRTALMTETRGESNIERLTHLRKNQFGLEMEDEVMELLTEALYKEIDELLILAGYGHDTIEDTRVTYNEVLKALGIKNVAEIIYALTNEKGKNRKQRANRKYYVGIRNTPGATFVKLCDRIANVRYSRSKWEEDPENNSMYQKYYEENFGFLTDLGISEDGTIYDPMKAHLREIFKPIADRLNSITLGI